MRPGMIVRPPTSTTRASAGILSAAAGPTTSITASSTTTVYPWRGAVPVPSMSRPLTRTRGVPISGPVRASLHLGPPGAPWRDRLVGGGDTQHLRLSIVAADHLQPDGQPLGREAAWHREGGMARDVEGVGEEAPAGHGGHPCVLLALDPARGGDRRRRARGRGRDQDG